MTRLKTLTIEGFGSIARTLTIKFDTKGFYLIKARNGIGKTTILSALTWVLYGKSIKPKSSIATWPKVRPKDYRGTRVSITLKTSKGEAYEIIRKEEFKEDSRTRKVNSLEVVGKLPDGLRDKKHFQSFIENYILGMSFTLFKNSVIFGQKLKRIIEEGSTDKKEVFEEAFALNFIEECKSLGIEKRNLLKEEGMELTQKKYAITNEARLISEQIESHNALIKAAKTITKNYEENLGKMELELRDMQKESERNLLAISDKLTLSGKKLLGINSKLKKEKLRLSNAQAKAFEYQTLEWDIENLQSTIKKKNGSKVILECLVCGSPLLESKVKALEKERKQAIVKLENDIADKESLKETLIPYLGIVKQAEEAIASLMKESNSISSNMKILENKKAAFEIPIKTLEKSIEEFKRQYKENLKGLGSNNKANLAKAKEKLAQTNAKLDKIFELIALVDEKIENYDWVIDKALSNSGIKAHIINLMLSKVNKKLKEYKLYIGFRVEININLNSARKEFNVFIYKESEVCMYEDLSGGQQQLVNVAMALAVHDIVNNLPERKTNILIMDEVFEGLDEENIELVAELLKIKSKEKAIYIITHQKPFNVSNSKTINLTSNNGITSLQI